MRRWILGVSVLLGAGVWADTAFTIGEWKVAFAAEGQSLRLVHAGSGAEIVGELAFTGSDRASEDEDEVKSAWTITDAGKGAPRRLLLVDAEKRRRGFLSFQSNGSRVSFLLCPEKGLTFPGELSYAGEIKYREDATAAVVTPHPEEHVLWLASGDADSMCADALYSAAKDELLQLDVPNLVLTSGGGGSFTFELVGASEEPAEACCAFTIERDYRRSRWGLNAGIGAFRGASTNEGPVSPYTVVAEQARVKATLDALPSGEVHLMAPYQRIEAYPLWDLHVKRPFGDWHVVALVNWTSKPSLIGFDWADIGEPSDRAFVCWEFWTESWQGVNLEHFEMQVPAHGVRLVALQPYQAHPQFLTYDQEVVQGGSALKNQRWSEDRLEMVLEVRGGVPMTVRVAVPESFTHRKVGIPEGVTATERKECGGKVIAVTLTCPQTRTVPVTLQF